MKKTPLFFILLLLISKICIAQNGRKLEDIMLNPIGTIASLATLVSNETGININTSFEFEKTKK